MKDYRVEVRVKNNLLYDAIVGEYGSIKKFCEIFKFSQCYIGELINMKIRSIYKERSNELTDTVKRLCDVLGKSVGELFPTQYYLEKNKVVLERNKEELVSLESCPEVLCLPAEDCTFDKVNNAELKRALDDVLDTLSPKEEEVIRLRHYEEESYDRIANKFGVCKERIRQIERKALSKLRQPGRSRKLKNYLYDVGEDEIQNADTLYCTSLSHILSEVLTKKLNKYWTKCEVKVEQQSSMCYCMTIRVSGHLCLFKVRQRITDIVEREFPIICRKKDMSTYYAEKLVYRDISKAELNIIYRRYVNWIKN